MHGLTKFLIVAAILATTAALGVIGAYYVTNLRPAPAQDSTLPPASGNETVPASTQNNPFADESLSNPFAEPIQEEYQNPFAGEDTEYENPFENL